MGGVTTLTRHSGTAPTGPAFGWPDDRVRAGPGIHNHDVLGSIARSQSIGLGYGFRARVSDAPRNDSSVALWRVLGRIVARHAGHTVAGKHGDGGRARCRLNAKPLLVHLGNRAVELHAFDGVLDRLAQLCRILAERRTPDEASRVQIR